MRRAALVGLAFRIISHKELEAAIIATPIAISLKARRPLLIAIAFSGLTFIIQLFLSGLGEALKYAIRVYLIITTLGSSLYSLPPEELLAISLRLRIPRSLSLIAFLTYSYIFRLTRKSIDAKLVAERKYVGFRDKLKGRLVGSINSIVEDAIALSEVLEAYLKTPFEPPKSYKLELIAFIIAIFLQFVPVPLSLTLTPRFSTTLVLDSLAPRLRL